MSNPQTDNDDINPFGDDFPDLESDFSNTEESADFGEFADFGDLGDIGDSPSSPADADFSSDFADTAPEPAAAPAVPDKKGKKEKPPKVKKEKPPKVKKEKPPKVKKEKPPKPPRDPNAPGMKLEQMFALGACALILIVVLAANALIATSEKGLGGSNLILLVVMDVISLMILAVPFLLFKYYDKVSFFEVGLGIALIAICVGVILLFAEWSRYDFEVNKAKTARHVVCSQDIVV